MIRGIIYHQLRSTSVARVWGNEKQLIDVAAVVDMSVRRRMFMIFDRDHPWELTLVCAFLRPRVRMETAPLFSVPVHGNSWSVGWAATQRIDFDYTIFRRYETAEEAQAEARDIRAKQDEMVLRMKQFMAGEDASDTTK